MHGPSLSELLNPIKKNQDTGQLIYQPLPAVERPHYKLGMNRFLATLGGTAGALVGYLIGVTSSGMQADGLWVGMLMAMYGFTVLSSIIDKYASWTKIEYIKWTNSR
jgi:hypothetical protein